MLRFASQFDAHHSRSCVLLRSGERLVRIESDGSDAFRKLALLESGVELNELLDGLAPSVRESFKETILDFLRLGYLEEYLDGANATPDPPPVISSVAPLPQELQQLLEASKAVAWRTDESLLDEIDMYLWPIARSTTRQIVQEFRQFDGKMAKICPVIASSGDFCQIGPILTSEESSCVLCSAFWRSSGLNRSADMLNVSFIGTWEKTLRERQIIPALVGAICSFSRTLKYSPNEIPLRVCTVSSPDIFPQVNWKIAMKAPQCPGCSILDPVVPWALVD